MHFVKFPTMKFVLALAALIAIAAATSKVHVSPTLDASTNDLFANLSFDCEGLGASYASDMRLGKFPVRRDGIEVHF